MTSSSRNSLRSRLIFAFFFLAIFQVSMTTLFVSHHSAEALEQISLELQQNMALAIGNRVNLFIEQQVDHLMHLSEMENIEILPKEQQRLLLNKYLQHQYIFENIALLDDNGREAIRVARSRVILNTDLKDRSGEKSFRIPASTGKNYLSHIFFHRQTGEPLISISIPLRDLRTGQGAGILLADLRVKNIWELLAGLQLSRTVEVYIVDQSQRIVAHRNPTIVLQQQIVKLPIQDGPAEHGLSGPDIIVATHPISLGTGILTVVVEQDRRTALALRAENLTFALVTMFISLFLVSLFSVFIIRRLFRPLEELAGSVRAVGKGTYPDELAVHGHDEVAELGTAFNQMARDIKQLVDQQEEIIKQRTAELEQTSGQLMHAEKLGAIGRLASSIAHEFNNPLCGIMNVLKGVSRRAVLEEEDRMLVTSAFNECTRMQKLILELQALNRPSSGIRTKVDLHSCIDSVLLLSKKALKSRHILVHREYLQNLPPILAVKDQVMQMIINLLTNGMDACEQGGEITITTRVVNEQVTLSFRDNGKGIPPDNLNRIFEPFFTTKPAVKGTGLGLSITYSIITQHGGTITVESEPGKGALFTIHFPPIKETNHG